MCYAIRALANSKQLTTLRWSQHHVEIFQLPPLPTKCNPKHHRKLHRSGEPLEEKNGLGHSLNHDIRLGNVIRICGV